MTTIFMDISINKEDIGRLEFELFSDKLPITCENFKSLCTGEKGKSLTDPDKYLHYKSNLFQKIFS